MTNKLRENRKKTKCLIPFPVLGEVQVWKTKYCKYTFLKLYLRQQILLLLTEKLRLSQKELLPWERPDSVWGQVHKMS